MKNLTREEINWATLFVLLFWFLLLVPWIWLCPASGMAFDSGDSLHARFFVLSVCTYPVAVLIAGLLRKAKPWLVLLPCINLVGFFVSGSYK
jgi:hypothetical protein